MLTLPRLHTGNPASARPSSGAGRTAAATLSNGFLPQSPLLHAAPTGVGVWDLESAGPVWRPTPTEAARDRPPACDQLLLVRLHSEPVTILALAAPPGEETPAMLLDAAWAYAADAIRLHARRHGCMPVPADGEDLRRALARAAGGCAASVPPRPPGHATAIVCTTGRAATLARCLESLAGMDCEDFDVVVVDNRPPLPASPSPRDRDRAPAPDRQPPSATHALVERLAAGGMRVRYVPEPRPGLAFARNAGVAAAPEAAFVAFVDDDVVADARWLGWLLAPFVDDDADAVTGLVMPLSLRHPAQKRFEQYAGFGKGVRRRVYGLHDPRMRARFLYPYFGGIFGSGNSMAFRRDALLAVGGFDPALGAGTPTGGGEDLAAFTEVLLRGGQIVYEPRALCWHEHRPEEAALQAQVRAYGIGLTAVFWRFLWRDRRFLLAGARSLPLTLRLARRRRRQRTQAVVPPELIHLEARARWLGPWRYLASRHRARRIGFAPGTAQRGRPPARHPDRPPARPPDRRPVRRRAPARP